MELLADHGVIAAIITAVLGLLGMLGINIAIVWKVLKFLKEFGEAAVAATKFNDGASEEEVDAFMKELNEAKGAWKNIFAVRK